MTFRGNVLGDDGAPAGLAAFQIDIADSLSSEKSFRLQPHAAPSEPITYLMANTFFKDPLTALNY